jgi:CheY-like chemotaxis protein
VVARLGLQVRAVTGQREALEVLATLSSSGQLRALVTDLLLADGDGLSLATRVRATHPALPIVVTSTSGAGVAESSMVALPKPFGVEQLREALSAAVKLVTPG